MNKISAFFKFLEDSVERKTPFKYKLFNAPELFTAEDLHFNGNLNIMGELLFGLPDNLTVNRFLSIDGLTLDHLPDNLTIGSYLSAYRSKLEEFPKNLKVLGDLDIRLTPLMERIIGETITGGADYSIDYHRAIRAKIREELETRGGQVKGLISIL